MDKYEEMARKISASSSVGQLLTIINLPYSIEIMAMSLPPKLKVLLVEMHDRSKDPIEHLEAFKAHMIHIIVARFHRQFREIR